MDIIQQGKVVFENGKITSISGFHVRDGGLPELRAYVESHYRFIREPKDTPKDNDARPA